MERNKRFLIIGVIVILLIALATTFTKKEKVPVESGPGPSVKAELEIKGLLYKDPMNGQLTLYERWEEPFYGVPHIVNGTDKMDLAPNINRIVLMGANSVQAADDANADQITAVSLAEVKELSEKERAQWIRFLVLNDLDRALSRNQAGEFIRNYPASEYIPDIYNYFAQVHLYDTAFQQAVDVLTEFISKHPGNDFYIEKFEREIKRIRQTYLVHPAYGKFIASQADWELLPSDELSKHVSTLTKALKEVKAEQDKGVARSDMIELLSRSDSEEAIEFLLDYQKEAAKVDRLAISKHLQSQINKGAVKKYYLQSLGSESASIKLQAAQTLGEAGADAEVVDALISLLEDSDERVVGAAAFALGKIGDKKAIAPLETLAGSSNPRLASAAALALKKIRK